MKHTLPIVLSAFLFAACGEPEAEVSQPEASAELRAVFVESIEEEAAPIHLVRTMVQPGDAIVLKGQVMGAMEPFVDGRAAFVLGDREKLTPCNERPDDPCPTPWDNCCDSKEALREGTATIQVVDAAGQVRQEGLEGVEDLEKLSKIRVKGRVAEGSTPANLVVTASEIEVLE